MQARVAFWSQFAIEEYKSCGGVQENNACSEKFLSGRRVLDFAVCLRLLRVERTRGLRLADMGRSGAAPVQIRWWVFRSG